MISRILSYLTLSLLWLLHFLPLVVLIPIGKGLGMIFYALGKKRRQIAQVNVRLCFPEKSEKEQNACVLKHFQMLGRAATEHALLWWASEKRLASLIHLKGEEHLIAAKKEGRAILLLAPHFVGLDMGGIAIATRYDAMSMYAAQKNPVFDAQVLQGRTRFGKQLLLSRQDGILATIKAMRRGLPFYYLPDMDLGKEGALFVPFFGVPAATITALPRLAKAAGALVMPCVTRLLSGNAGYEVQLFPPWDQFPSDDLFADTRRMNAFIETQIQTMPEQYYWVHRRFKTRQKGELGFYV